MENDGDRFDYENEEQTEQIVAETAGGAKANKIIEGIKRNMDSCVEEVGRDIRKHFDDLFKEQREEFIKMKERMDKQDEQMKKQEEQMKKQQHEIDRLKQSFSNYMRAFMMDVSKNVDQFKSKMDNTLEQFKTNMDNTLEIHLKKLESGDGRSDEPSPKRRRCTRRIN